MADHLSAASPCGPFLEGRTVNQHAVTLTLAEILSLSPEQAESLLPIPRPRSMPPPAPPARRLDPLEASQLAKYQDEIQEKERRHREKAILRGILGTKKLRRVARDTGISYSEVRRVLHGTTEPKVTTFIRLTRALGCKGQELFDYLKAAWKRQGYRR